jgi:hypothetical protein
MLRRMPYWWDWDDSARFWCEITDRPDEDPGAVLVECVG